MVAKHTWTHLIIEMHKHSYLCLYLYLVGKIFNRHILIYFFEIFSYSYLYLPVPLGVLKKSHREMFVPSLSKGKKCLYLIFFTEISEKVEAIEKIEFGRVGKVFLRWPALSPILQGLISAKV